MWSPDAGLRAYRFLDGQIYLLLVVALPEVCNSFEIISVDESGTFVPKQTPNGVSVLDRPVGSFLIAMSVRTKHTIKV
jgi:hypothetical protein